MATGPTITARFLADTSALTSGVNQATGQASGKLNSFAKNAATAIGTAFVATQVVAFGKAAVKAAADDAEAQDQLASALRNTTDATDAQIEASEKYISNLSKQAAIADDELRPALATLARGFGDTEEAQKALSIATDVAAGTGKDLKTVVEAMSKAALGSTGGLKKLGVATTDAAGKALSMDQIMQNLAKTFDGQAKVAAESTAGQMRAADIAMGELSESIGTTVMPIVARLAEVMTTYLLPAIDALLGNKAGMIALTVVVGALFLAWAAGAVAAAAATLAATWPIVAIGATVAAAAIIIIKNWDSIKAAIQAVFNWIKDHWGLLLTTLTGPIGAAVWIITAHWEKIKAGATAVYEWVKDKWLAMSGAISAVIGVISSSINTIVTQIKRPIAAATEVWWWITDRFNAIARAIANVIGSISTSIGKIVSAIKAPINAVIRAWNQMHFAVPRFTIGGWDPPGPGPKVPSVTLGGQRFDFPNLPELAKGGVLTSPTLFVGGEAGREIVTPETLLRQIMREEGAGATYVLNMYPREVSPSDLAYAFRRLELMSGHRG